MCPVDVGNREMFAPETEVLPDCPITTAVIHTYIHTYIHYMVFYNYRTHLYYFCTLFEPTGQLYFSNYNDCENRNTLTVVNRNENHVDFQSENNIKIKMMSYKTYKN